MQKLPNNAFVITRIFPPGVLRFFFTIDGVPKINT